MPVVPCHRCGTPTEKTSTQIRKQSRLFCGSACFYASNRGESHWRFSRVQVRCDTCGKAFMRQQRHLQRGTKRYCSHVCHGIGKVKRFQTACEFCGTPLDRHQCRTKYAHQFCNARCKADWKAAQALTPIPCQMCGKDFLVRKYRLKKDPERRFCCSRLCRAEWMSIYNRGPANVQWRGGAIPYYGPNWETQRRLARRRDGNRCRECGVRAKGRLLHVHHIRPFRTFGYVRGRNDAYLQGNDLSNLITLCCPCHRRAEPKSA